MKKIASLVFVAVAFWFIIIGGQKWLHTRDVNAVVHQFFTAVEEGKTSSAQKLLSTKLREAAKAGLQKKDATLPLPEPGLTHSIHKTKVTGKTAIVNVVIEKQGFVLKPIVYLEKSSTNRWQITAINNLTKDPLWEDVQREQARQQDNQLDNQLKQAFAGRKDITIQHEE